MPSCGIVRDMRMWSLHPSLLDRAGLLACWRESLLAQKVLRGLTVGYRNHPQLRRFREHPEPVEAVGAYLAALADEADARGYRFDRGRIARPDAAPAPIEVARGQLDYELRHLLAKLAVRDPERIPAVTAAGPLPHPLFRAVPGPIAEWELVREEK